MESIRTRFKLVEASDIPRTQAKSPKPKPVHYDIEGNKITSTFDNEGTRRMTAIDFEAEITAYEKSKWKYRSEEFMKKERRKERGAKILRVVSPLVELGMLAGIVVGTDYDAAAHGIGKIELKHARHAEEPEKPPIELFIGNELKEKQEQKIQGLMDTLAAPFFVDPANLYPPTTQNEKIRKNMAGSLPKEDIIDKAGNKTNLGRVVLDKHTYNYKVVTDKTGRANSAYVDDIYLDATPDGPIYVAKFLEMTRNASGDYTVQGYPINGIGVSLKDRPFVDLSTDGESTFPTDKPLEMVTNFVNETMTNASVLQPVIRKKDNQQ